MNSNSPDFVSERNDVDAHLPRANIGGPLANQCRELATRKLLGRIDAVEGDSDWALRQAEQLIVSAQSRNHGSMLLEGLLIKAYVLLKKGQNDRGIAALRQGLLLGGQTPLPTIVLFDADDNERDISSNALDMSTQPVRIHTLGRFEVLVDGKPLRIAAKVPKKPLELLRALIAMSGRSVDVKTLLMQVWPKDGVSARCSFDVTLMRLRKLLGHADALLLDQGELTLNEAKCWVDAWVFESAVARLDASVAGEDIVGPLALYRGPFLCGQELPCIVNMRDRLASKFQRAVLQLGQLQEQVECWGAAAAMYRRGLEQDNLAEEFYRRLMFCEWRRGHQIEAVKAYRRCCQVLSINLQVKPSADTEALYRRVIAN
jgi:DNA-binding SARP family transcriptional activator